MAAVRRALAIAVIVVIALAAGYAGSRLLDGSDLPAPPPVIDLDRLPPVDSPPSTAPVDDGARVVPAPTSPQPGRPSRCGR